VERDLREMQTKPVSTAELEQAKTLLLRRIPPSTSSTDGIATGLLDLSIQDLPLDEPLRFAHPGSSRPFSRRRCRGPGKDQAVSALRLPKTGPRQGKTG
jgi:hypothetical protein